MSKVLSNEEGVPSHTIWRHIPLGPIADDDVASSVTSNVEETLDITHLRLVNHYRRNQAYLNEGIEDGRFTLVNVDVGSNRSLLKPSASKLPSTILNPCLYRNTVRIIDTDA